MEKQEIIRLFLSHGFQLSEGAVKIIEKDPEYFLEEIENFNPRPFIITEQVAKKIVESKKEKNLEVRLLQKTTFRKDVLKPDDFIRKFLEIYEKISKILIENKKLVKLISINKISEKTETFSIIAMVREKNKTNLILEDKTGEIVAFPDENLKDEIETIELDDVLGFVCENKDRIYIKEVIFPDIPINRDINTTEKDARLFYFYKPSLLNQDEINKIFEILRNLKKQKFIFIYGGWEDRESTNIFGEVQLIPDEEEMMIFEIGNVTLMSIKECEIVNVLRKRLLKTSNQLDTFVLEKIPDIIFSKNGTYYKNYKGTTILSLDKKDKYFVVNLKTRDVEECEV